MSTGSTCSRENEGSKETLPDAFLCIFVQSLEKVEPVDLDVSACVHIGMLQFEWETLHISHVSIDAFAFLLPHNWPAIIKKINESCEQEFHTTQKTMVK